jgi:hypothetical protein
MKKIIIIILCNTLIYYFSAAQERTSLFKNDKYEVIFDYYKDLTCDGMPFKNVFYIKSQNQNDTVNYPGTFPLGKAFYDGKYLVSSLGTTSLGAFSIKEKINGVWIPLVWHQSGIPRNRREGLIYSLDAIDATHVEETLKEASGVITKNLYEINMDKKEYTMYRLSLERGREVLKTFPFPVYRTKK